MNNFTPVNPDSFDFSVFRLIGKDWMLITAEKDGKVNTMTASWGGLGVIWARNVAYIFVRKSRYTKEFIDNSGTFSLTFFDHSKYAKELMYLGTVSGRNEDKIVKAGLTVCHIDSTPYFNEAQTVILCKKICGPIPMKDSLPADIDSNFYKDKDYHDIYIGEITQILKQQE